MSNESSSTTPLNLLQDCIIAGSGANNSDNDINMQRKCQQQIRDGESSSSTTPFHNFMDILRDRATSSVFTTSSNNSSKANAYSNMRQDFNISSKVWGGM